MSGILLLSGIRGYVLAAALFAALAIWLGRRADGATSGKLMIAALALTAAWALSLAFSGQYLLEIGLLAGLANCAWATTLFTLPRIRETLAEGQRRGIGMIYGVLIFTLLLQGGMDVVMNQMPPGKAYEVAATGALSLRTIWAMGALIMAQRLFAAAAPRDRLAIAPVMATVAAMWSYELILHGARLMQWGWHDALFQYQGWMFALLAPVLALSARQNGAAALQASRALAERLTGLIAIIAVALSLLAGFAFAGLLPSPLLRGVAATALFCLIVAALVVLPSDRFRAWVKVMVAKHFFAHRYDYRQQWMDFADTMSNRATADAPLQERVIKAMADITGSPGGLLLLPDARGCLRVESQWRWPEEPPFGAELTGAIIDQLQSRHWVVDVDASRASDMLPVWIGRSQTAWALVPIIHFDRLTAVLLLARPPLNRALDWEDFDMLRTAGRQAASYIAEARTQEQLAETRRFDEFNRRFAFILHDIKNLVSQLSLLSRNAEKHADNPEFRADMILTLRESAGRMNELLARLSRNSGGTSGPAMPVTLGEIARQVARVKGQGHPVMVDGNLALEALGDGTRVEQILLHLLQNAIDASTADCPVLIRIGQMDDMACIHVIDRGTGMSGEFMRNELFRPFSSSKPGGFGIGVYEARELAQAMQGDLEVESVLGKGTRFTLRLRQYRAQQDGQPHPASPHSGPHDKERAA